MKKESGSVRVGLFSIYIEVSVVDIGGGDEAVAALLTLVNNGEAVLVLLVEEGEELMLQKVHLQDGLLGSHGLEGEALGANNAEIVALVILLFGNVFGLDVPLKGALAELLFKTGLVLAYLTLDGSHRGIDGGVHIACQLACAEIHTVVVQRDFDSAAATLGGEGDGGFAFPFEELVQLANLLFGVGDHLAIDLQLAFDKVILHISHSFCCFLGEG